jgi:DNA-binding CsgD family transcriptional regulator
MDSNRNGPYAALCAERNIGGNGANGVSHEVVPLNTGRYRDRIHLTPRERQVLGLLAEGLSNKLICRRLNISTGTVKIHVARVLAELRASTRLQAVITAHRLGLLEIQTPRREPNLVIPNDGAGCASSQAVGEPRQVRFGSAT